MNRYKAIYMTFAFAFFMIFIILSFYVRPPQPYRSATINEVSQNRYDTPVATKETTENIVNYTNNTKDELTIMLDRIEKERPACSDNYFIYGRITNINTNTYNWLKYKIIYVNQDKTILEDEKMITVASKINHANMIEIKEPLKTPDSWDMKIEFPLNNCDPIKPINTTNDFIRAEIVEAGYNETIYYR